jgi:hypothetical protein
VSRKWRKARKEPHAAMPTVPYGPPVATTVTAHRSGNGTLKTVAVVGATIAAPYILKGLLKLLAKR